MPYMMVRGARFTGAPVAVCPACGATCAYWDDEDLDVTGRLVCDRCPIDLDRPGWSPFVG